MIIAYNFIVGPPVFLVSPQPLWVANESEFTLNCIAIGSPAPTISWELNKLPINMSAIGAVQHPNGSLTIPQANPSTVGFFTCVADNGVNVGESTAQVDILFPESGGLSWQQSSLFLKITCTIHTCSSV